LAYKIKENVIGEYFPNY